MDAAADKIESFKRQMTVLAAEVLVKVIPILKMMSNGFGFIGDMVGVAASNALSFGQALGSVISAVVAPAIKQFNALGFAIKAAGQVAKRDFAGAKESLIAAKEAAGDSVDAIKAIPDEIGAAFNRLKSDGEAAMEVLGDSLEKRADNIGKAWSDMTGGMVEDTKDAAKDINKTAITPTGTGAEGGKARLAGKTKTKAQSFDAADVNKSGIVTGREMRAKESADRKAASDARRAKTLEVAREAGAGERARAEATNQRFNAREAAAGLNLAGNDPLSGREPIEEEAKKQTEELEIINKTLAKLDSALTS
jgi:hypothetical protein